MRLKFYFITSLLSILLSSVSFGQNVLLLKRGSHPKNNLVYQTGDVFIYKTKNYDFYLTDVIKEIHSDYLLLGETVLSVPQITAIDISQKDQRNYTLNNLSYLSIGGGLLLTSADVINSLYQEQGFSLNPTVGVIGVSMIASGIVIKKIRYKHFKVNKKNKIQIIKSEELEN
jgi:hypothetical protein